MTKAQSSVRCMRVEENWKWGRFERYAHHQRRAVRTIQRHWRAYVRMVSHRDGCMRGYRANHLYIECLVLVVLLSVSLQVHQLIRYSSWRLAARCLQRVERGRQARALLRRVRKNRLEQRAANFIQACWWVRLTRVACVRTRALSVAHYPFSPCVYLLAHRIWFLAIPRPGEGSLGAVLRAESARGGTADG